MLMEILASDIKTGVFLVRAELGKQNLRSVNGFVCNCGQGCLCRNCFVTTLIRGFVEASTVSTYKQAVKDARGLIATSVGSKHLQLKRVFTMYLFSFR